ncbi:MAG: DUF364 domain-containing protein [Methylococcaceae bacterium]|jgi:hypothetical protein
MDKPERIYQLLLDSCSTNAKIDSLTIGLVWTLCKSSENNAAGLAMSPGLATRVLPWSGSLTGKPIVDLAAWIWQWEPYQATVAMAAINACINSRTLPEAILLEPDPEYANLAVFDYFLPQLQDKKVVIIGHYPGIERYREQMQLTILERQPSPGDLPDAACEYLLPQADWVFLTASSIPNKTFPRLAELSANANTVLMGPTVPWLPQLHEFGINYLAGVKIADINALEQTVAQGGGVRIFNQGVRYCIAALEPTTSLAWIKQQIIDCVAEKTRLTTAMEAWYSAGNSQRFAEYALLDKVNIRLSTLDSSYKPLWDSYGNKYNPLG